MDRPVRAKAAEGTLGTGSRDGQGAVRGAMRTWLCQCRLSGMFALLWLLPLTLGLGAGGLALFMWCVRSGQFEDLDGAAWRILRDDPPRRAVSGRQSRDGQG
jgi:cbb3-type cytochrome oxidase maturation protein